jgi:hypothetical protein
VVRACPFSTSPSTFGAVDHYARATEALARGRVEKLESVIDEMRAGKIGVDVARVEIDAWTWIASKLFRPTRGEKLGVVGGDAAHRDAPVRVITHHDWVKAIAAVLHKTTVQVDGRASPSVMPLKAHRPKPD